MDIVAFQPNPVRTGPDDWSAILKSSIRDPHELLRQLQLPADLLAGTAAAHRQFRCFVPGPYLDRIQPGDPQDPLLLQVLPQAAESEKEPGFTLDAVGDLAAERAPGLIHKYHGRVLLMTRGACAIHCRYCFRRHYPYDSAPLSIAALERSLEVVRRDASIEEVILSGGDPLMMVDSQLSELVSLIESIDHVQRLRIHTRLPVVIPQRVTPELTALLTHSRLKRLIVLHINHAREIDQAVLEAAEQLSNARCTLLNQAVLLRGVNDDLETQVALCKRLLEMDCLPYYLHQLDRVAGAAHFEVPETEGLRLLQQMRDRLPGYAVPRYVREVAGAASKQWL